MNQKMTTTTTSTMAPAGERSGLMQEITSPQDSVLAPTDTFVRRHIGPRDDEMGEMLKLLGYDSLDQLSDAAVPAAIRLKRPLRLGPARGEHELLCELRAIAK